MSLLTREQAFDRLTEANKLLQAARHGLLSYAFGNDSPDLATSLDNKIAEFLSRTMEEAQ